MKAAMLFVLLVTCSAFAQEGRVIQLEPQDAKEAKEIYNNMQKAEKAWADFQSTLREHYLTVSSDDPEKGYSISLGSGVVITSTTGCFRTITISSGVVSPVCSQLEEEAERDRLREQEKKQKYTRSGWEGEFIFSKDFKFILPAPLEFHNGNYVYTTPAIGVTN